jgi:hypothetical protein
MIYLIGATGHPGLFTATTLVSVLVGDDVRTGRIDRFSQVPSRVRVVFP